MQILGIETSCDETAVCIIEANGDISDANIKILGNELYSQIAIHAEYGGVYPNLAKREHAKNLVPLLKKCILESKTLSENKVVLSDSKKEEIKKILEKEPELFDQFSSLFGDNIPNIDLISVTNGPGLEPALWVGVSFAKALSKLWGIPILPVNHMEGHIIVSPLEKIDNNEYKLKEINYPAITLLISGGHTQLVKVEKNFSYKIVGNTKDDAVGEAFDKVARILGLPYPGGPQISRLAENERRENPNKVSEYKLTRPMINSKDLNFSFSGIKTAVLYLTKKIPDMTDQIKQDIAKEFEDAVVEVLIKKTSDAVIEFNARTILIGGGVSANKKIRNDFKKLSEDLNVELMIPEVSASTDNAFMIAISGFINKIKGKEPTDEFSANGNLSLEDQA